MDFLALCRRLRHEAGIDGTGPETVVGNANNEYASVVYWINDAYAEIQSKHDDWHFLWDSFSFQTTPAQADYTSAAVLVGKPAGTRLARYDTTSLRFYQTATGVIGEQFMLCHDYRSFNDVHRFGANRTTGGQPLFFTVAPNKSLLLAPVPDAAYTVTGDYYRAPFQMAADGDEPILPAEFHMILVWWALMKNAGFEETSFQYQHARNQVGLLMPKLERQERPKFESADALC